MENRYKETHHTWNKVAKQYEEAFMELDLYNNTYQQFCDKIIHSRANILEIGCGPGNITRQILNLKPQFNMLAIDISENMIHLARKNNPAANFHVLDCRKLNSLEGPFDGIVGGFVIPYLSQKDCSKMIQDCGSLLADKGIMYLSFVEGKYENSRFISGSSGDRTFFYFHHLQKIESAFKDNNMQVESIQYVDYKRSDSELETHTIVLARKRKNI